MRQNYSAKRLPHLVGPAAWAEILSLQAAFPILEEDTLADIVIIGAGFAGLTAAHELHKQDQTLRIVIIDALTIAHSSAGRNSGFMIDLPHVLTSTNYDGNHSNNQLTQLNRYAIKYAEHMVENYDIPRDYFDKRGKINGAASAYADQHNRDYGQMLKAKNEPFEYLNQKQMQEITGSSHYLSGLYTPGTVLLQPAGYIHGLACGLSHQVAIYENSPALSFDKQGQSWRIKTPKGKLDAKKIILANNGHLASFGIETNSLMQVFLFASMTEKLNHDALKTLGGEARWGVTPSDPMGTTMRKIDSPLGGHRIVTRTCARLQSNMKISKKDVVQAGKVHKDKFAQRFPQLKHIPQEYQWSGHLCLTMNDVSLVKEIDENLYTAAVQNGLGTARGTLTGIASAQEALGQTSEVLTFFHEEAPPKNLLPEPFRGWGANAFMKYKEWRAKDE